MNIYEIPEAYENAYAAATDEEYDALKTRIRQDGFETMQAWLTYMIRHYLRSKQSNNF